MKRIVCRIAPVIFMAYLMGLSHPVTVTAQQVQIPTLQVCNQTAVTGKAVVKIMSRSDTTHSGIFEVAVDLSCHLPDILREALRSTT